MTSPLLAGSGKLYYYGRDSVKHILLDNDHESYAVMEVEKIPGEMIKTWLAAQTCLALRTRKMMQGNLNESNDRD